MADRDKTKDITDRFEKWWAEDGQYIDRDSDNVKTLAELAFAKGVEIGTAWSRNYTANSSVDPDRIHFANGRVVKLSRETGRIYLSVLEGDKR